MIFENEEKKKAWEYFKVENLFKLVQVHFLLWSLFRLAFHQTFQKIFFLSVFHINNDTILIFWVELITYFYIFVTTRPYVVF